MSDCPQKPSFSRQYVTQNRNSAPRTTPLMKYIRFSLIYHAVHSSSKTKICLKLLFSLRDSLTGYNHLKLDPQYYSKDALQNFKLAKRFMYQWKLIHRSVRDNPIESE